MPIPRHGSTPPSRKQRRAGASRKRGAGRRVVEADDLPDLQKARGLWQAKRFPEALDLFERTVRKHPNNLMALTDTARAFGARYEVDKAEAYLGRMLNLAPEDAVVQMQAGQSYRMIYRPDKAIACLQQAVALMPNLMEARLELAILLERRGQLAEALEHVDAIRKNHEYPAEVEVIGGRLSRRLKDREQAIQQLSTVIDSDDVFWSTRQHAGMELARAYDGQGDYDAAAEVAQRAKGFALPHVEAAVSPRDLALQEAWEYVCDNISRDHFTRWADAMRDVPKRRVALLSGPPRSGTTLLENILDAHPDLVSSDERDAFPRYIHGKMLADAKPEETAIELLERQTVPTIVGMRERYLGFMQSALGEKIGDRLHLDKNPSISPLIPGVLRLFPECKIILALRDPRDVVLSCYMTHMPLNSQSAPYLDFKSAAEHYVKTMRAWLALREQLDPEQYLEVRYEDVVADTESQARRALAFLDLPWDDGVLRFQEHVAGKQVDSPTYEQVGQPIYTSSIGRWKQYERHMAPALDILQPMVATLGYD
ncbi:MAG: sulfotransferase [Planctomycetota bacterium]